MPDFYNDYLDWIDAWLDPDSDSFDDDELEYQKKLVTNKMPLSLIGHEDWQFEPFFDFDKDEIITQGNIVDDWLKWLNT